MRRFDESPVASWKLGVSLNCFLFSEVDFFFFFNFLVGDFCSLSISWENVSELVAISSVCCRRDLLEFKL